MSSDRYLLKSQCQFKLYNNLSKRRVGIATNLYEIIIYLTNVSFLLLYNKASCEK